MSAQSARPKRSEEAIDRVVKAEAETSRRVSNECELGKGAQPTSAYSVQTTHLVIYPLGVMQRGLSKPPLDVSTAMSNSGHCCVACSRTALKTFHSLSGMADEKYWNIAPGRMVPVVVRVVAGSELPIRRRV